MFIWQCCPSCMIHKSDIIVKLGQTVLCFKRHMHVPAQTCICLCKNYEGIAMRWLQNVVRLNVKTPNLICITGFPRNSSLSNSNHFRQETPWQGTAVNWSEVSVLDRSKWAVRRQSRSQTRRPHSRFCRMPSRRKLQAENGNMLKKCWSV